MTLGSLTFSSPWILLATGIFMMVIVWWMRVIWRRTTSIPLTLGKIRPGFFARHAQRIKIITVLIIILFAGCTLAGPSWGIATFVSEKKGIDVMIALDLSYSMLATDLTPDRLGAAKRVLGEFLTHMDGNRVGIVVFAGKALTLVPLTDDLDFVRDTTSTITFDTIDQCGGQLYGTNLSDALALTAKNLADGRAPNRGQAIVVVTDGGKEIKLQNTGLPAAIHAQNPVIFTVGIGKTEGVTLDAPFPCNGGAFPQAERDVRLNTALLQEVAKTGGGQFFQARTNQELSRALMDELAVLRAGIIEKREVHGQPLTKITLLICALAAFGLGILIWRHPTFE